MPTYDYKCSDCSDVFETTHGVDDALERCPKCGGKVRRLFHPVGIIFKGSGFYKTDSRSASDNGGDKPGTDKAGEKPEKKAEKVKESTSKEDTGSGNASEKQDV